jgi:hypothetical protein
LYLHTAAAIWLSTTTTSSTNTSATTDRSPVQRHHINIDVMLAQCCALLM